MADAPQYPDQDLFEPLAEELAAAGLSNGPAWRAVDGWMRNRHEPYGFLFCEVREIIWTAYRRARRMRLMAETKSDSSHS
jgi:hypothetical protein